MIKRYYFMSVIKNHGDGQMSHSWMHTTADYTSFLPKSEYVFEQLLNQITEQMKDKPGDKIQVIAFNRI